MTGEPCVALVLLLLAGPAAPARPLSLKLERSIDTDHFHRVLRTLRMRRRFNSTARFASRGGSIGLEQDVLNEKQISTYYARVQIGPVEFRMLMDTGSYELWVPSDQCDTDRCRLHRRYPWSRTDSWRHHTSRRFKVKYLSGQVEGSLVTERLVIDGLEIPRIAVGAASDVDIRLLDDIAWDGILGLAYPPAPSSDTTMIDDRVPVFDALMRLGALHSRGLANQFGYYINDKSGSFSLGGVDCAVLRTDKGPSPNPNSNPNSNPNPHINTNFNHGDFKSEEEDCSDKFAFSPRVPWSGDLSYWTVRITGVSLSYPRDPARGGRVEVLNGVCDGPEGCVGIVDTGTYLIYGPPADVQRVLPPQLPSCEQHQQLPDITFTLTGFGDDCKARDDGEKWTQMQGCEGGVPVELTLTPPDYIVEFDADGQRQCVVGLAPDDPTESPRVWTLGQSFLRTFYTLFDRESNRIGFARLTPSRTRVSVLENPQRDELRRRRDAGRQFAQRYPLTPAVWGGVANADGV